jgi:hypothetical protein
MNYVADANNDFITMFLLSFYIFQANFSKHLTTIPLTFVKNMNYSTCTLAASQRG